MSDAALEPKTQESIEAALAQDWEKALELNLELVKKYPDDAETLNRLARAYLELGQVSKAKTSYNKVLKLDQYNSIAANNLKRLANIKKEDIQNAQSTINGNINLDIFLEEPGKTKVIKIFDLAMPRILAGLRIGDRLNLEAKKDDVIVFSAERKRLGKIDAETSKTLSKALRAGSKFVALVKSVRMKSSSSDSALSIFVKEIHHSPKLAQNIFPVASSHFTPYVREETLGFLSDKNSASSEPDGSREQEEAESSMKEVSRDVSQTSSLETLAEKENQEEQNYED